MDPRPKLQKLIDASPCIRCSHGYGVRERVADLSKHSGSHLNDMVVDRSGRAYIGNYGFDLVGRADLNAVRSGHFVVGYWLGEGQTGRGFATAAVRALIDFGRAVLGATEFWAGVTHGNEASIRVLERLGFEFVERLERHTRFHLAP